MKVSEAVKKAEKANEAEARILQLQDENKSLKHRLKLAHRQNSLYTALASEIRDAAPTLPPLPRPRKNPTNKGKIRETLVIHLSDEHADQVVLPHRVEGLEEYNLQVALARAERMVDATIDYTQHSLSNYAFEHCVILANGDHVNGEIHDAKDHSEYRNAIRNTLAVGQMHGLMIRDLAAWFPRVTVVYTAGNHGRFTPKKDYDGGAWENWDYLVGETARAMCKEHTHVEFIIPDAFSLNLSIEGWVFNVSHGDDVKSWNGIPFYGLERQTRRLQALAAARNSQIHYFCRGHFHNASSMSTTTGELLVNGAWKATDCYSLHAFGGFGQPAQLIHGVHKKHGVSWRMPVHLKFDGDTKGPKRYKIDLAEP